MLDPDEIAASNAPNVTEYEARGSLVDLRPVEGAIKLSGVLTANPSTGIAEIVITEAQSEEVLVSFDQIDYQAPTVIIVVGDQIQAFTVNPSITPDDMGLADSALNDMRMLLNSDVVCRDEASNEAALRWSQKLGLDIAEPQEIPITLGRAEAELAQVVEAVVDLELNTDVEQVSFLEREDIELHRAVRRALFEFSNLPDDEIMGVVEGIVSQIDPEQVFAEIENLPAESPVEGRPSIKQAISAVLIHSIGSYADDGGLESKCIEVTREVGRILRARQELQVVSHFSQNIRQLDFPAAFRSYTLVRIEALYERLEQINAGRTAGLQTEADARTTRFVNRLLHFTNNACQQFEYAVKELPGRHISDDLFTKFSAQLLATEIGLGQQQRRVDDFSHELARDPSEVDNLAVAQECLLIHGELIELLEAAQDITREAYRASKT